MVPYELLDAVDHAAAHPRSFFIPSDELRTSLQPGDIVKLVFRVVGGTDDGQGERMWVEVTDVAPGGYVGVLTNEPVVVPGLRQTARVEFEPRHVIDVWSDEPDPLDAQTAFVNKRLLEDDDLEPGALVFVPETDGEQLADGRIARGWQLFVGDETPEELDDVDAFRLPSLSWLVQRYPQLLPIVTDHDGSDASWIGVRDRLVPVPQRGEPRDE